LEVSSLSQFSFVPPSGAHRFPKQTSFAIRAMQACSVVGCGYTRVLKQNFSNMKIYKCVMFLYLEFSGIN
jgi:hypothetical protein